MSCGNEPRWGRDGKELFYRNECAPPNADGTPTALMVALPFDPVRGAAAGPPHDLFRVRSVQSPLTYDVTADGQRFIFVKSSNEEVRPAHLNVILNIGDDLRRGVPIAR